MQANKADIMLITRMKKREDFVSTARLGQKWVSRGLIIQRHTYSRTDDKVREDPLVRVGFTVTKKTEKSAVKRNRIKRRLRAVVAEVLPSYIKKGKFSNHCIDIVLIGRRETADRGYDDLKNDLKWCLKKLDQKESGE